MSEEVRREVHRELRRGALAIQGTAVESIIDQTPSGKFVRSRGRKGALHEVSPPGAPPNADTGELHTSITTVDRENSPRRIEVEVGANAPYAAALEYGTSKMEPRPFMSPAFRLHVNRIEGNVRRAVQRALRRRRP